MAERNSTRRLDAAVKNLQKRGVALPKHAGRARLAAASMHEMASSPRESLGRYGFVDGKTENPVTLKQIEENNRLIRAMGSQRRMSRTASGAGGGDVFAAIPRFYDPMEYWDLSGLPWNMADENHRHKLHKWLRLYYSTHYLVPILIDIFTRFPLVGMELECKDKKLEKWYTELFLDQLDYPEFLVNLGREFWTVGEAYPLGSFNESMGIWEREELINPEDIAIENFPLLGETQLKITPPDYLKKLVQTKSPPKQYKQLEMNFPELIPYLRKNEKIPISGVLLKQVANKLNSWDDHGTPILLRGLRTLMHEEKLLASQDAIAERLYSPLILARLGVMDLGDGQGPWIPSPEELDSFRDDMDLALSSDFRLLVHHFGLEVENVFGREQMPRLGDDFDRIERRIMQIFGVNPSLLSAGSSSQPYASSALQAEFLNQILRTFQGYLKKHFRERALVVAEAQEHWEYDTRGRQTRVPVMEEVRVVDEEGNERYETRHKLLIPDLKFQTLDLRDEATERQFLQTLRAMGVPVPDSKLTVGMDVDMPDWYAETNDELVKKTVSQQEAKLKAYKALEAAGLPIPPDLKAEVETVLGAGEGGPAAAPAGGLPNMPSGMGGPGGPGPTGGPGEQIVMPTPPAGILGPGGFGQPMAPGGSPPPAGAGPQGGPAGGANAPAVSMERRQGIGPPAGIRASVEDSQSPNIDSGEPIVHDYDQANLENLRERDEEEDQTVVRLPKAANRKRYRIVDEYDEESA